MNKEATVTIRVSEEEKQEIAKAANTENRTISNYLLWCWKRLKELSK